MSFSFFFNFKSDLSHYDRLFLLCLLSLVSCIFSFIFTQKHSTIFVLRRGDDYHHMGMMITFDVIVGSMVEHVVLPVTSRAQSHDCGSGLYEWASWLLVATSSYEEAVRPHDCDRHPHFHIVHHLAVWTPPFLSQMAR